MQSPQGIFAFDRKKVDGYKAMERAPQGEVRTPTAQWAGLGLSKTSPFALETASNIVDANNSRNQWVRNAGNSSPYNMGVTTSILESAPADKRAVLTHQKDIHSLMTHLGLEHYISKYTHDSQKI